MTAHACIVDTLGEKEFTDSHLPGAISLPLEVIGDQALGRLDPNKPTVVYCYDSICDRSSRAAARLIGLGFREVYDYVASKVEWMGAGLPFEGTRAEQPHLATLVERNVATCGLRETTTDVRTRIGDAPMCVVVDDKRVVLGIVTRDALNGANAVIAAAMDEGPLTFRPHKSAVEVAKKLDADAEPWVLVSTLDGRLVGVADTVNVRRAAGSASKAA